MLVDLLAALALAAWAAVLLLPSRPWTTSEQLESVRGAATRSRATDLPPIAVLIPARNESDSIAAVISALARQRLPLRVILIDDRSDDATAEVATAANRAEESSVDLTIVAGAPLPDGWGGKLWALEQGLAQVREDYCLLLDADIVLDEGIVATLVQRATAEGRALVSIMAQLRCSSFWEKLLVPPFIYFFKLLYPFRKVNDPERRTAAAAGGCMLVRTAVLREIGGFAAIRDALIDDCTLAARIKGAGYAIWLGLSTEVHSLRRYDRFFEFRRMVTRTAFTQLRYSLTLLTLVTLVMTLVFIVPLVGLTGMLGLIGFWLSLLAWLAMLISFLPTVRYYGLRGIWVPTLPLAGILFLGMTLESAVNYWRGIRAEWKGRRYASRR